MVERDTKGKLLKSNTEGGVRYSGGTAGGGVGYRGKTVGSGVGYTERTVGGIR